MAGAGDQFYVGRPAGRHHRGQERVHSDADGIDTGIVTRLSLRYVVGPCSRLDGEAQRALAPAERQRVLDALHEPRLADLAPATVYITLLDEGTYHCS